MIHSYYLGDSIQTINALRQYYRQLEEDPNYYLSSQFQHGKKSEWEKTLPKNISGLVYFETGDHIQEEIDLLKIIRMFNPKFQWVLISNGSLDYFHIAKLFKIGNILQKGKFDFSIIRALTIRLMTGNVFGFDPYFPNGFTADPVVKKIQGRTHLKEILGYFEANFLPHVIPMMHNRMSTYFNELLVNTISYSVVGMTPEERDQGNLSIASETYTPPVKAFTISMAVDSEKYGISILDSTGTLTLNRILEKLRKQSRIGDEEHPPGIWDLSGRGFALILKDNRMIFNILNGVYTEIIFLHYIEPALNKYESIIITELSPSL